jgi:hypothetical protein
MLDTESLRFRIKAVQLPVVDEFSALPMSRQQRWQLRRKRDGKCRACGKGPLANSDFCAACAEKNKPASRKQRNPAKYYAREAVRQALKNGMLLRGYCHCGLIGEAHHEDYSKPLEVTWLCARHHKQKHGRRHLADMIAADLKTAKAAKEKAAYLQWLGEFMEQERSKPVTAGKWSVKHRRLLKAVRSFAICPGFVE